MFTHGSINHLKDFSKWQMEIKWSTSSRLAMEKHMDEIRDSSYLMAFSLQKVTRVNFVLDYLNIWLVVTNSFDDGTRVTIVYSSFRRFSFWFISISIQSIFYLFYSYAKVVDFFLFTRTDFVLFVCIWQVVTNSSDEGTKVFSSYVEKLRRQF